MPEQVNRSQSRVHNSKKTLSFVENIELQLQAGDTIENLEVTTQEQIEAAEKEVQRLRDGNAANDVIKSATKKHEKWVAYGKAIKKYKKTKEITEQLEAEVAKTKECYADTTRLGEEVIEYINSLDVEDLGNISNKTDLLNEKIFEFESHIGIQIKLKKKSIDLLNELKDLKPNYDVYEQYRNLIPNYEGKTIDFVKSKYKEIMLKVKALEEKREKGQFLNDKKKYTALIEALNATTEKVLPYLLSNSKKMEAIRKEVADELGIQFVPKQPQGEGLDGERTDDEINPGTGDSGRTGGNNENGRSGSGNTGDNDPYVPPVQAVENPKFKEAKAEYINIIESINKLVDKINDFNAQQSLYAREPMLNLDRIIATEHEVLKANAKITEYKDMLAELEYRKYVDEHIMLNLDPEVRDMKPREPIYASDLEDFMYLHNGVISECYYRLQEIEDIPNSQLNPKLKAESDKLIEVIDAQHLIIDRRMIAERHKNKDFDIIKFMDEHRVFMMFPPRRQDFGNPFANPEPTFRFDGYPFEADEDEFVDPNIDEEQISRELESNIEDFKLQIFTLYVAKQLLKFKLDPAAVIDQEQQQIEEQIIAFESAIRNRIDNSGLGVEKRNMFHTRIDSVRIQASAELDTKFAGKEQIHTIREEFAKDVRTLLLYAESLSKMTAEQIETEEYKTLLANYTAKASEIQTKYAEHGVKISVAPTKTTVSVDPKSPINIFNISAAPAQVEKLEIKVATQVKTKEESSELTVRILKSGLNLGGKIQTDVDRKAALIATTKKIRLTLLKNSIRVKYTKQMLAELKSLKVKLEVAASADNQNDIQVTKAKETKDKQSEYRRIENPTKLTEAKLVYRDEETNEELASYDILANEEIQEALEERRKMSK